MPLSAFMFKYKQPLGGISGRSFQLPRVNLYLHTITAVLFSYFFTGDGGGGDHNNFNVGVLDFVSPGLRAANNLRW